jgi:hypothetical protein
MVLGGSPVGPEVDRQSRLRAIPGVSLRVYHQALFRVLALASWPVVIVATAASLVAVTASGPAG